MLYNHIPTLIFLRKYIKSVVGLKSENIKWDIGTQCSVTSPHMGLSHGSCFVYGGGYVNQ